MGRFLALAASYGASRLLLTLVVLIPAFMGAEAADIGRIELLLVSVALAWSVGASGLGVAVAHADFRDGRQDWLRSLLTGAVVAAVFAFTTQFLMADDLFLFAALLGFVGGAQKLTQHRLRVAGDLRDLGVTTVAMLVVFAVVLGLGLLVGGEITELIAWALLAGLAAMALFGFFAMPRNLRRLPSQFYPMLLLATPLAGAALAGEMVAVADRYLIDWLVGTAEVGRYGVAYRLVALLNGAGAAAVTWWAAESLRRGHLWSHRILMTRWPVIVGGIMATGFAAWPVITWLTATGLRESFGEVAFLVGWLVAGSLAFIFTTGLLAVTEAGRRAAPSAWTWLAGAALNIAINLLLIPMFQETGAAIATAISYLATAAVALAFYRVAYSSRDESDQVEERVT